MINVLNFIKECFFIIILAAFNTVIIVFLQNIGHFLEQFTVRHLFFIRLRLLVWHPFFTFLLNLSCLHLQRPNFNQSLVKHQLSSWYHSVVQMFHQTFYLTSSSILVHLNRYAIIDYRLSACMRAMFLNLGRGFHLLVYHAYLFQYHLVS